VEVEALPRTGTAARELGVAAARNEPRWRFETRPRTGTAARRVGVAAARHQSVVHLNTLTSNQLLETLEHWNAVLEAAYLFSEPD
jgi:hypothetical protein